MQGISRRGFVISAVAAGAAIGGSVMLALSVLIGPAQAQRPPPQFPNMMFFITSIGGPDGANFGGIEGADRHCSALATKAGAGSKTWRAYLSTQGTAGKPAINARDRIGKGPWVNVKGEQIAADVGELHSDKNKIDRLTGLSDRGRRIPSRIYVVNQHDILTGSTPDGRAFPPGEDMTCGNWTKNGAGKAQIGHFDRMSGRTGPLAKSWNSAHGSRGCSLGLLKKSGGAGLIYCFAAN